MPCSELLCRLNAELLELLPMLDVKQQQRILRRWRNLNLAEREALLAHLRQPVPDEADLVTLAKLADYFQCGIYDMVRYTRLQGSTKDETSSQ